jgi:hypothetical protein
LIVPPQKHASPPHKQGSGPDDIIDEKKEGKARKKERKKERKLKK